MDSAVDPSADYIWDSVGTIVGVEGTVEKAPKTDDEWKEERRKAVMLVEAANLLMMPGRKVAKTGEKADNPDVELGPEQIQELIDKDRATFLGYATKFQKTAIEQLQFVDARNVEGMLKAGGELDARCEACHRKYWYPNDPNLPEFEEPK
jgi:hypothetical protein